MELIDYLGNISGQLFAFSAELSGDQKEATGVVADSLQALLIEDEEQIVEFNDTKFKREALLRALFNYCYKICCARIQKDLSGKAVLFLKYKSDFNWDEMGEILSLGKNELIALFNHKREELLTREGFTHQELSKAIDRCRRSRSVLSLYDLGNLDEKSENHLQSCKDCKYVISEAASMDLKLESLIEYQSLIGASKDQLMARFAEILKTVQKPKASKSFLIVTGKRLKALLSVLSSKTMIILYAIAAIYIVIVKFLIAS